AQRDDVCDYMRTQTLGARALWTTLSAQIPVFVDRLIGTCDAHWRDVKALQRADILLLKGTGYQQSLLYQNTLYGFAPAEEGWQLQVIQDISGMAQAARRSTEAPATMMQEEDGAEMPAPEADQPEAADESAAAPIPDVQVALTFDLGQVEVPIATLESWQPGTIVDLGETPNAADAVVTIRANGTAIAEGDIVQLDDRIGVRVTRLLFNG
ncbi:MAG: FliM/FliN family flagellar motor switch protein, partial [Pseudomonadota bacterium]